MSSSNPSSIIFLLDMMQGLVLDLKRIGLDLDSAISVFILGKAAKKIAVEEH